MKRITLFFAGALACLLFASVGTAAAMPTEGIVNQACTTTSSNTVPKKITAVVAGKNVAQSQMRYANCGIVKKVVRRITNLRIEMPKIIEGYRCTPSVLSTEPDVVRYGCLFRGADTATEIHVRFKVTYNQD